MKKSKLTLEEISRLPSLQGDENDYGDYDYLANDIPSDYSGKKIHNCHCDSCGRDVRTGFESCHYFYTLDGYDSMSYVECRRCYSDTPINKMKMKIKKFIRHRKSVRCAKVTVRNTMKFSHKKLTREEKKSLIKLLTK